MRTGNWAFIVVVPDADFQAQSAHMTRRLLWLADAVRPASDVSVFAISTGRGTPRAGLHGELLLVRASVEATIG